METIENMIPNIATAICFGCQVNYPSQTQHNVCLMMSKADQVEECWDIALERKKAVVVWARRKEGGKLSK